MICGITDVQPNFQARSWSTEDNPDMNTQHQSVAEEKGTAMLVTTLREHLQTVKDRKKKYRCDSTQAFDHESPLSIITSVLLRFLPSSTTRGRSGCFTSTASATRRRALDTLTCRATLTCTIWLSKRSEPAVG
jgi:hypothetical protein